jgi:hypothetical protein
MPQFLYVMGLAMIIASLLALFGFVALEVRDYLLR